MPISPLGFTQRRTGNLAQEIPEMASIPEQPLQKKTSSALVARTLKNLIPKVTISKSAPVSRHGSKPASSTSSPSQSGSPNPGWATTTSYAVARTGNLAEGVGSRFLGTSSTSDSQLTIAGTSQADDSPVGLQSRKLYPVTGTAGVPGSTVKDSQNVGLRSNTDETTREDAILSSADFWFEQVKALGLGRRIFGPIPLLAASSDSGNVSGYSRTRRAI